jgi:hypothetical protein
MKQNGRGMLLVNLKNKTFQPGLECMIIQTKMGILVPDMVPTGVVPHRAEQV